MADNYLEKRYEELFGGRGGAAPSRKAPEGVETLLHRTRSHRAYDKSYEVMELQLEALVRGASLVPSARNQQVLRFKLLTRRSGSEKMQGLYRLGGALPEKGSRRSADEANTAIRYCILRGVSGTVFHMGHGGVPESRTRLWSFLRGAERAVNAWYPAWATGTPVDVAAASEEGVEIGARKTSAGWILIAVNLDPHRRSFSFTDPSTGKRRTIRLTGFGSVVVAENAGSFVNRDCRID